MCNKSLKSDQILRAHMTYFRRPSHIYYELFVNIYICPAHFLLYNIIVIVIILLSFFIVRFGIDITGFSIMVYFIVVTQLYPW